MSNANATTAFKSWRIWGSSLVTGNCLDADYAEGAELAEGRTGGRLARFESWSL
jgi:hypothetical protein